jgi:exodeoxyribonuclease VII small subunit
MAKKIDFEKSLETLEAIVEALEAGDLTLEQSLKKFEEGLALGKQCREILETAEARIKKVIEASDGTVEEKDISDEF